jgi:heptosyltransferase I
MSLSSILIIKPSSLGDIVHTLPAVHFLKDSFPTARIRWIANSEWLPILAENPDLETVIPFPRREFRGLNGWFRFLAWNLKLSSLRPDLVLDFQGLFRSAWMSRSAGGTRVLGLSDSREGARFFYKNVAHVNARQHAVDRYLALAKLAGARLEGPAVFPLPAGHKPNNFEMPDNAILLHPFARGSGKSLSPGEITHLVQFLAPAPIIVIGQSEIDLIFDRNAISLVNQTNLFQLIWLIRKSAFVISVDSGPMHIAAAITPQLLSIHTWSDPRLVGPYNPDAWVWKSGKIRRVRSLSLETFPTTESQRPDPLQLATFVRSHIGS